MEVGVEWKFGNGSGCRMEVRQWKCAMEVGVEWKFSNGSGCRIEVRQWKWVYRMEF